MSVVDECYRSDRVRVFRLDRAAAIDRLRARSERLISERADVLEVRLFGSLARGEAVPGSDADLLVVPSTTAKPFLDRGLEYARYFTGSGIGCDLFVYTQGEIRSLVDAGHQLLRRALGDSITLASRSGIRDTQSTA